MQARNLCPNKLVYVQTGDFRPSFSHARLCCSDGLNGNTLSLYSSVMTLYVEFVENGHIPCFLKRALGSFITAST